MGANVRRLNVLLAGMGNAVIGWSCNTKIERGQTGPSANDRSMFKMPWPLSRLVDSPRGRVIPLEQAKAELFEHLWEEQRISYIFE